MTRIKTIKDLKVQLQPELVERLIAVATNPRDKAFILF
jgi:hypothetical protein